MLISVHRRSGLTRRDDGARACRDREDNMSVPAPARSLRDWLARLGESGRLSVTRPGIGLLHEAAAVANRLDGRSAPLFPRPDGQDGTIVLGLVSSRAWMAEALGTT